MPRQIAQRFLDVMQTAADSVLGQMPEETSIPALVE